MRTFWKFGAVGVLIAGISTCKLSILEKKSEENQASDQTPTDRPVLPGPPPVSPDEKKPENPTLPKVAKAAYSAAELTALRNDSLARVSASDRNIIASSDIIEWVSNISGTANLGTCLAYFKVFTENTDYRFVIACLGADNVVKMQIEAGLLTSSSSLNFQLKPLYHSCVDQTYFSRPEGQALSHLDNFRFTARPQFGYSTAYVHSVWGASMQLADYLQNQPLYGFEGCDSNYEGTGLPAMHNAVCQTMARSLDAIRQETNSFCLVRNGQNVADMIANPVRLPNF